MQKHFVDKEEKEEIWLSPMTKASTPIDKSKNQCDNIKRHQNFDYTTIADQFGITIVTQLVWLDRFTGSQPSH